jgi:hypothetical protein
MHGLVVLTQGRGGRVPVSNASAHVGCWCLMVLPGHLGQPPRHGGVVIQRGPAVAGERDGGLGSVAAGLFRPHVPGVVQLPQTGDQAGGV